MGTVIVGPWKPRPTNERIEHERSILKRIAELSRNLPQQQDRPMPLTNPREQRN